MPRTYSTYDAKAKLSEILRLVRRGQTVLISHRGVPVAEVRPVNRDSVTLDDRLDDLASRGALSRSRDGGRTLGPIARKPGALQRFLEDRNG